MAQFKESKNSRWYLNHYQIKLSNDEIEEVDMASKPIAALSGFIPQAGMFIAPAIVGLMYWIKRKNNADGKHGVVIELYKPVLGAIPLPVIRSITAWEN